MNKKITDILENSSLSIDEKYENLVKTLHPLPDMGVNEVRQFIHKINDSAAATYPANYLSLLPNLQDEKQQIVKYILDEKNQLVIAATNLVKDMPDEVVESLIDKYLDNSSSSDIYSIIFEVAQHFPDKLHQFYEQIEDKYLKEAILPGGLDSWVDDIVNQYRKNEDLETLQALAWFRTDKARDALINIAKSQEDQEYIYAYLENSGVFPDTRVASIYFNNYRGYIVSREESSHHMGGNFLYPVPKCPFTDIPANHILTLDTSQLDLDIESSYNPSFFWYEGEHPPDCIYVQFTEKGIKGLMTPMTNGEVGTDLIPGELALKLEKYPLKHGRGGTANSGFSLHQVGGYPQFIRLERFPRCPICSKGMKFLVSIDSGMTPFGRLGFEGILYGFWCDECAVSCTYRQTDDDYFE